MLSFFKSYLPKSLLWRAVLIVVMPMVILQAIVASLIVQRHFDGVTRQMTTSAATELRYVLTIANGSSTFAEARSEVARAARTLGFSLVLEPGGAIPPSVDLLFFDVIGNAVEDTMSEMLGKPLFVAYDRSEKVVDVRVATRWGALVAQMPRSRVIASNPHLLLTWMGAAALGLMAVALLYLRNQIRPIQELADAAAAFGKGRSVPMKIAGAAEVRLAASAFLDARTRIERHIEQRTRMLSGVSHDLRTPLTRMKLALEVMEDSGELRELKHDVREMEHILEEFLAYARGDHGEAFVEVDAQALAQEVVSEARRKGARVSLFEQIESSAASHLRLRQQALKRCLHNLLDNALTHGERALLSLTVAPSYVEFAVEDDGPGIPPEKREEAFRPFYQLDESRNRNDGHGVGLGLALALDTMRAHGGDITLDESPSFGGLRARARLPR
ncbi:MAG: ATP-binding protein [Pseudomonadota bacterium]